MLYDRLEGGKVQCRLCSHRCRISLGKRGLCAVRENREGVLYTLNYNVVSSEAVDPIEKKPLFHFRPGSLAYSLGTIGCNFRCKHCQNWTISQIDIDESNAIEMSPEVAVERALASGAEVIAWTYNEPTIWFEYTYDCAKLAKEAGLGTVYVTNGYITREGLEMIAPYLDAFRVDIKAFTEKFYHDIAGAKLAPVLESAKLARELGMHVEVINLIIPTLNDSPDEIREMCVWIRENLGRETPVHFTRFHPYYKLQNLPSTPLVTLERAYDIAREEDLQYVYVGNVPGTEYENTFCPQCGELLIKRGMFSVELNRMTDERTCPRCGRQIAIVTGH
ncbi:pyruvate formate lyase activating enzyme [Methanolobus profundi]|uniref:Pyruvate formate lyase activating enzyme n=2 Tax=Methanolobus profundi TaxID=487685 RepID=A0A1I4P0I5_9EURY|nr:pyruvate formate lyase activating enzyme [Methanolobus profundi]